MLSRPACGVSFALLGNAHSFALVVVVVEVLIVVVAVVSTAFLFVTD